MRKPSRSVKELGAGADPGVSNDDPDPVIEHGGPKFFERLREIDPELGVQMDRYLERWGLRTIDYCADLWS